MFLFQLTGAQTDHRLDEDKAAWALNLDVSYQA
jgi:hypothetical protein